ncbi:MAG: SMC-Scp complex subunit ScpB, partial [Methylobacteriaceae bacterium]|nr:SMC-Scp complex subunit ScpB [Methylobacteriaceae bacterium]
VRMRGRRRSPGRPVTYGTTPRFLDHFGLGAVTDLPGLDELLGLGLVEKRPGLRIDIPVPRDDALPCDDEDPIEVDLSLSAGPDEPTS